jgi:starch synthase (maltosyl-transferring)
MPGARLLYRQASTPEWTEAAMRPVGNDRWEGTFVAGQIGTYVFTVEAWVNHFRSWWRDFERKLLAGLGTELDLLTGIELIRQSATQANGLDAEKLKEWAATLESGVAGRGGAPFALNVALNVALNPQLAELAAGYSDRGGAVRYPCELPVRVDRVRARFSAWYEMFPRSCAEGDRHGTFRDCEARLEYIAQMGFDVLYLPPIHPIGKSKRKGRNNNPAAAIGEPGSPWAIGSEEGGHKAIHPQLGTLEDLQRLRARAAGLGIELAMDIALQATPDHPYVRQHPEWFRHRPDGSIQYAENPPKKYEDIYPFDFESPHWRELWEEMKSIFVFWAEQGIRIFRVDNPHTKPFAFWEWLIAGVREQYPETIFLGEAFTRPKVMYRLAKVGFSQSYTYFAWRNTKHELTQYMLELTQTKVREYFRPNFWPNTPDILPENLQYQGKSAFAARLVLAATLSSCYGIYGPAFELLENAPVEPGREEYLNSEKYEIKHWEWERQDGLKDFIARINGIRQGNPAMQSNHRLRFHPIDNDQLIAYSKTTEDLSNRILVIVNLDAFHPQAGWLQLPLQELGLDPRQSFQVHDLLANTRFFWQGEKSYVKIDPEVSPAHIFLLRRRVRTERDFDYYI